MSTDLETPGGIIVVITAIFQVIMFFITFITISAIAGFDSCTCGYGEEVRQSVHSVFTEKCQTTKSTSTGK